MLLNDFLRRTALPSVALAAIFLPSAVSAQEQSAAPAAKASSDNDGTDPTRPVRTASVQYEHLALRNNFTSDVITVNYSQPIGSGRSAVRMEVPLSSVDVLGDRSLGLGDISVKYTNIPVVTREYGIVIGAELVLNTADRPELGTGKNVFKPSFIYAKFLKNGSIIAPSLVHNVSLWGDKGRQSVSLTTFDLYYVPRLKNKKLYMTVDPALNVDWKNDKFYPALAVTMGHKLGGMLGGNGQVFVKPSATFFKDRPTNWGVKVGFQLLNF